MPALVLPFFKLSPGGNPTILVDDARTASLPAPERAAIANALLHADHLHADQVGFLSAVGGVPHMEMMGGEFCVNAVRSAAVVFAQKGLLPEENPGEWRGKVSTSGATEPVLVAVRKISPVAYESALALPLPSLEAVLPLGEGETLVRLPGIVHLILDGEHHPLPDDPLTAAREKRMEHGLDGENAAGVVWHMRESGNAQRIVPVVHVAATGSAVLESACGSGSLALALAVAPQRGLEVLQPSGHILAVRFTPEAAWISGVVTLTARGETYLSR